MFGLGFFQIFLIGVGLSMDAFAISLCQGLIMGKVKIGKNVLIGPRVSFLNRKNCKDSIYLLNISGNYANIRILCRKYF